MGRTVWAEGRTGLGRGVITRYGNTGVRYLGSLIIITAVRIGGGSLLAQGLPLHYKVVLAVLRGVIVWWCVVKPIVLHLPIWCCRVTLVTVLRYLVHVVVLLLGGPFRIETDRSARVLTSLHCW